MSSGVVAALFCVVVLAAGGWADEKQAPPGPAKSDDKGKEKKPAFRTGAVRYQVKDVSKSVEFYTKHLGFKVDERFPVAPASPPSRTGASRSGSAARRVRAPARCPTAASRSRAGGTGSSSKSMT